MGWILITVGFGVLSLLDEKSSRAMYIGCQIPVAVGLGLVWVGTQFPILAPLPFSNSAHALSFFTFVRCFAQVSRVYWPYPSHAEAGFALQSWGIVVGGTILQNVLLNKLPKSFTSQFPQGVQIAYAIIPTISGLPEPLQGQVRAAFAQATRLIWRVMIGISGAGFLSVFLMRELKLREDRDAQWGLQDEKDVGKKEVRMAAMLLDAPD